MSFRGWASKFVGNHERLRYCLRVIKRIRDPKFVQAVNHMRDGTYVIYTEERGEDNKGKLLFEINLETTAGFGFFALFRVVLNNMYVAWIMGAYPVVSISKDFAYYEPDGVEGIYNPWEYYFEQYGGMSIDDLSNAFRVVPHWNRSEKNIDESTKGYLVSEKYIEALAPVMRKYIKLNKKTEKIILTDIRKTLGDKKTLGVHIHIRLMSKGLVDHPKVATLEEYIQVIKTVVLEEGFEQIFLATDELDTVERMEQVFSGKLVYYTDSYRNRNGDVVFTRDLRELHNYRMGLEVLRDMYTLADCEGLVAGLSQVSIAARIAKRSKEEKYLYEHIFNLGVYEKGFDPVEYQKRKEQEYEDVRLREQKSNN